MRNTEKASSLERIVNYILIIAGLLSVVACLLVIASNARQAGFNDGFDYGLNYCRAFPDVCTGGDIGAGFGA